MGLHEIFPEISVPGTFLQGITFSQTVAYAPVVYRGDFCTHKRDEKCAGPVSLLGFSDAITHALLRTAATSAAVCCIIKIKRFNMNPNM